MNKKIDRQTIKEWVSDWNTAKSVFTFPDIYNNAPELRLFYCRRYVK